jgi:hypothetical protein
MKRFLLSSLLLLAMGRPAYCYTDNGTSFINNGDVQVPTMDPQLVQIDDTNFVNNGVFSVDMTLIQDPFSSAALFTTSRTLNYTNNGLMTGVPGFDFENFPATVGQAGMAANFVNNASGLSGGEIFVTNVAVFSVNGVLQDYGAVKVRATNVVDSGLISIDNTGLIDIGGQDLDLGRGRFLMRAAFANAPTFGINIIDFGAGLFGDTNNFPWVPSIDLTPTTALTPFFQSTPTATFEIMQLTNAVVYFQSLNPAPGADGIIVWRGIYLQDHSPANVTPNVFFGSGFDPGAFHIEWAGQYRDPLTGQIATNYFDLSDDPAARRNTNGFFAFPPSDFTFAESTTSLAAGATLATPGYANPAPPGIVSNDFSFISLAPSASLVSTSSIVGGSITNIPGRIQLSASHSMNLANVRISGANYLSLNTPVNLINNSNAAIAAPFSDLNIGVTNSSLVLSNLLIPELPAWSGVIDAPPAVFIFGVTPAQMGGLQAWSGSYIFVDANGVTNDVRMLLVNSALQPTSPTLQKDLFLHEPNNLVIADEFNVFGHFASDATTLTISTNDSSAFSLAGQLNLLSPDIFWSASFTNLLYLTNWGRISTENLANFAGNMFSPNSDPAGATPYQAFVNHGTIIDQGIFVRANYFENSGIIAELLNNGIDIGITGPALSTNSVFSAPFGPVSIAANSLLISNGVVTAGQALTLNMSCFLSDGYVFGNQFGHSTNSVLPNVVTNGNIWSVNGGIKIGNRIGNKPATGDLLGTTITNISFNNLDSVTVWPGEDRGASPAGYANNLALGRMILKADAEPSHFTFQSLTGSNALYVDSIEFQGSATATDTNGNIRAVTIQPGMKIYYAQALVNGVSFAEKLNGKNGGGFLWVSNYAGVYSSTNIPYPDGNTYIFNDALAISPDIDSDGDGTVNVNDPTPIPAGLTFDIVNNGPQPCGGGGITNTNGNGPGTNSSSSARAQGGLEFPQHPSNSTAVSFTLAQGSYNGLFYETNGVNPATSGFFTANMTSKGSFTAKLLLGGKTYSFFKPAFDSSGHFAGSIAGKGLPSLSVDLQLINNDEIAGEVFGNGWTAELVADRAAFTSKSSPPSDWVGNDTLVLATEDTNSTVAAGDVFGTVSVGKNGNVQFVGTLPDGTKVTQKSALSKDGVWPLYATPYGGSGSLMGWMQVTNDDTNITGSAVWIAPAGKSGAYPNGLTNDLDAAGSSVTGLIGALAQSELTLSGPSLLSSVTNSVMISGKNGPFSNGTLQLIVNVKTGLFNGSVVDPNSSQKLSFQGALLEKSGIGGGFFLNADKNQGGKVYLSPAN